MLMTNSVFLYSEVNLPPVPSELLTDQIVKSLSWQVWTPDKSFSRTYIKNGQQLKGCGYGKAIVDYEPLLSWIKNTVPAWPEHEELTIQHAMPQGTDQGATQVAHTDLRRLFALNYMISTGGDQVVTSFYKDRNHSLCRGGTGFDNKKQPEMDTVDGAVNYDNLDCVASFKAEKHKWYLLRVNALHEVDHVDSTRSSITIPYFDDGIVDYFKTRKLFKQVVEYKGVIK
jgi:hypothetical protein